MVGVVHPKAQRRTGRISRVPASGLPLPEFLPSFLPSRGRTFPAAVVSFASAALGKSFLVFSSLLFPAPHIAKGGLIRFLHPFCND